MSHKNIISNSTTQINKNMPFIKRPLSKFKFIFRQNVSQE